jgi:hypothetical protein
MSRDKNQLEFDFIAGDKACRTCTYLVSDVGVDWRGREGRHYACTLGGFKMSTKVVNFKDECNSFKWGGEKMPFSQYKELKEVGESEVSNRRNARVAKRIPGGDNRRRGKSEVIRL